MRRREKFVLSSLILTAGLFSMQFVDLTERYLLLLGLVIGSYLIASWALADDLQWYERITLVPFVPLYMGVVGLFYFLLPENIISLAATMGIFGVGAYALLLAGNIFSVAKGRSIQLLHAAQAIQMLFGVLMSLLFTNVLFSFYWPFWWNGLALGGFHLILASMIYWSIELPRSWEGIRELVPYAVYTGLLLLELGILFSLVPFSVWHKALFVMALVYVIFGIVENHIKGRLYQKTITEYGLAFGFIVVLFLAWFPKK